MSPRTNCRAAQNECLANLMYGRSTAAPQLSQTFAMTRISDDDIFRSIAAKDFSALSQRPLRLCVIFFLSSRAVPSILHIGPSPNQKRSRQPPPSLTRVHAQPHPDKRKQSRRNHCGIPLYHRQGNTHREIQIVDQKAQQKLEQHRTLTRTSKVRSSRCS